MKDEDMFPKVRAIFWCEVKVEEMHLIYKPTGVRGTGGYEYRLEEVK